MNSGQKLLMTMTGEIHQPVRLYYEVYDKAKVLQVLKTLRCVQFDLDKDGWVWLFQSETKKFKFATPYGKIPKHRRPLVLGVFHFPQEDVMWLDVRSHQRATKAIVFFDRRIPRSAAQVTHAAIVNRLFGVTTATLPPLDALFDEAKIIEKDPEEILQTAAPLRAIPDVRERIDQAFALMDQKSREPLPDVEKFPVHFYEDGIKSFETALKLRQMVAFEHWQGNTEFTFGDIMQKIIPGL
ncbi:MAG: hypothetical protein ETSY2_03130 [Candidatus Entotheonella gemina]|uniref:Uncharacterized protein n=1 Tax=Candidatus Entotheonella gemina TaxID=1429439 RepID=W4MF97_9BACT|nr:MAG: hypothetical protein ETSY2_03130 [Candidatus Entotheonella gemina]